MSISSTSRLMEKAVYLFTHSVHVPLLCSNTTDWLSSVNPIVFSKLWLNRTALSLCRPCSPALPQLPVLLTAETCSLKYWSVSGLSLREMLICPFVHLSHYGFVFACWRNMWYILSFEGYSLFRCSLVFIMEKSLIINKYFSS